MPASLSSPHFCAPSFRLINKGLPENFCSSSLHQAENTVHGAYSPHIDSLRTFAAPAVVLYPLQEEACPGGCRKAEAH